MENSQFKFRAWHKQNKRMMYRGFFDRNWYTESKAGKCIEGIHPSDANDVELMQYTGLKDKNDIEIYEGDIVNISGSGLCIAKIEPYGGVVYGCIDKNMFDTDAHDVAAEEEDIFVVGNIHENHDLLTGKSSKQ